MILSVCVCMYVCVCVCVLTVSKFSAAVAQNGSVDEEQMSTAQLDATYGPLRELVSESVHQQESVLERVQVSTGGIWLSFSTDN